MIKNKFSIQEISQSEVILSVNSTASITDATYYLSYDYYDPIVDIFVKKHALVQKFSSKLSLVILLLISITGIALAEALLVESTAFMTFFVGLTTILNQLLSTLVLHLLFNSFMITLFYVLTTLFYSYLAILPQNISQHRNLMTGNEMIKE